MPLLGPGPQAQSIVVMSCGVRKRTAFPSPFSYLTIQPMLLLEFRRSLGHARRTLAIALCVYVAGVEQSEGALTNRRKQIG